MHNIDYKKNDLKDTNIQSHQQKGNEHNIIIRNYIYFYKNLILYIYYMVHNKLLRPMVDIP